MVEHKHHFNGGKTVNYIPDLESMVVFVDAEPMKTEQRDPSLRSQDLLPNDPLKLAL